MVTHIDIVDPGDGLTVRFMLDGTVLGTASGLSWTDILEQPFAAVYLNGVRLYDIEVWESGNLRYKVPRQDALVDEIYTSIEEARDGWPGEDASTAPMPRSPDQEAFSENLKAIRTEIAQHPGQIWELRWLGLRRSVDVHNRNAKDLGSLIDAVAASSEIGIEMFQNTRQPIVRQEIEGRLDQGLHNYVASAASLIDHSRRLMNRYRDSRFLHEYSGRREEITSSPEARFIRDLRNYTLHYELPFVGYTVSLGVGGSATTTSFQLSADALRQWNGWSAPATQLLDRAVEGVALRDVLIRHVDLLKGLYEWIFRQVKELHRFEFTLVEDLRLEHDWILSGGDEGRPKRYGRFSSTPRME